MPIITKLEAKEILDSRGTPTVSLVCTLQNGKQGSASVPSGVSTGMHEAYELRDGDSKRFNGKGVFKAVENINGEIAKFFLGKEINQEILDESLIKLDGTKNKSRLGANAMLAVSLAFARAEAASKGFELYEHLADLYYQGKNKNKRAYKIPEPAFNTIEGGRHSDSGLSFQEFLLVPVGFKSIKEKLEVMNNIIALLKNNFLKEGQTAAMGDEGGLAPKLSSNEKALECLETAIVSAGYDTDKVKIALDAAATTFFKDGFYDTENKKLNTKEMIDMYEGLCNRHKIISIEDGLDEEDFDGFAQMTERLGGKVNIVGDDITVTNIELIEKAIENKSINTLLIKPNQIGTLSETLEAIALARKNSIKIFVSHRGGETEDSFIADLAVAVGADFIKAGAPTKKERMAKYNRLVEIEERIK